MSTRSSPVKRTLMGCPVKAAKAKPVTDCCDYVFKPDGCRNITECQWRGYLVNRTLWAYLVAAIVVIIVVASLILGRHTADVNAWARLPGWLDSAGSVVLVGGAVILLAAYATFLAGVCSGTYWNAGVGSLFLIASIALIVGVWLMYSSENFTGAFWAFLIASIATFLHLLVCFRNHQTAWIIVFPLLAVLVYLTSTTYSMMKDSSDCFDPCTPVFGLPEPELLVV